MHLTAFSTIMTKALHFSIIKKNISSSIASLISLHTIKNISTLHTKMPSTRDRFHWGRGFHAFVGSGIPARHTALYILYLLLASGVFGASLLYHRLLLARCRDAIDLSQSASSIIERYGSMDGTKTAEFRASLKGTVSQVLDDKLPMLISRACVSGRWGNLFVANFAHTKVC